MPTTAAAIRATSDRISLWIPGPPPTQGSVKYVGMGRIIHDNSAKLSVWRAQLRHAVEALTPDDHKHLPLEGPLELAVMATLRRPIRHYRKSGQLKQTAPTLPTVRPDLDKIIRAIDDALTLANAWRDDSQVVRVLALKAYALDPLEEGTEVLIRRAQGQLTLE